MQIWIEVETEIRDHVRQLEDMFAQGQFYWTYSGQVIDWWSFCHTFPVFHTLKVSHTHVRCQAMDSSCGSQLLHVIVAVNCVRFQVFILIEQVTPYSRPTWAYTFWHQCQRRCNHWYGTYIRWRLWHRKANAMVLGEKTHMQRHSDVICEALIFFF